MSDRRGFDRVAATYDSTRGGDARGVWLAKDLAPRFIEGQPTLEIGIGTGVVAKGHVDLGCEVIGIEIGVEMATRARDRIRDLPNPDAQLVGATRAHILVFEKP